MDSTRTHTRLCTHTPWWTLPLLAPIISLQVLRTQQFSNIPSAFLFVFILSTVNPVFKNYTFSRIFTLSSNFLNFLFLSIHPSNFAYGLFPLLGNIPFFSRVFLFCFLCFSLSPHPIFSNVFIFALPLFLFFILPLDF